METVHKVNWDEKEKRKKFKANKSNTLKERMARVRGHLRRIPHSRSSVRVRSHIRRPQRIISRRAIRKFFGS